jgi:hypothetical protein
MNHREHEAGCKILRTVGPLPEKKTRRELCTRARLHCFFRLLRRGSTRDVIDYSDLTRLFKLF